MPVIYDESRICPECRQPLPPAERRYDSPPPMIWWQMATEKPGVTRMMTYHYACGSAVLERDGLEICWAGCQLPIWPDQEKTWTDPDGDGEPQWMHSRCAGGRSVILHDIVDEIERAG